MKLFRALPCLCLVVLAFASCDDPLPDVDVGADGHENPASAGGATGAAGAGGAQAPASIDSEAVEESASALTAGTYYQSPAWPTTDSFMYSYSCAGQWWTFVQPLRQVFNYGTSWSVGMTVDTPYWTLPNENIVQLKCSSSIPMYGPGTGNLLYSTAAQSWTCDFWARLANSTAWQWTATVSIPLYGIQYRPAWDSRSPAAGTNGIWQIDVQAPNQSGTDLYKWGTGYGLSACVSPTNGHLAVYLK